MDTRTYDKRIANITRRRKNLSVPLRKAGLYLEQETEKQFAQERDFNGLPWKDLKPATWKQKKGATILTETGAMRRSFYYRETNKTLEFGLSDPKAKFHQDERPIIGLNKKRVDAIAKMLKSYIAKGV